MNTTGPFDELILTSPTGDGYKVTVTDAGALLVTKIVTTPPEAVKPTVTDIKVIVTATTATASWMLNNGTTVTVGRSGKDSTGYGEWTSEPITLNTQPFTHLIPNTDYVITITPAGGAAVSQTIRTLVESPPVTNPNPAPVPGSNPLNFKSMTSGFAVSDAANGNANLWVGRKVMGLYATWAADGKVWGIDTPSSEYGANSITRLGNYDLDIAPQSKITTWAAAAAGALDGKWRSEITELKTKWGTRTATVYYRMWHEFNGDWYNWSVRSVADQANFIKAWRRFYGIWKSIMGNDPRFLIEWCPNRDSKYGLDVRNSYPGKDYVDVHGVDYYDFGFRQSDLASTWEIEKNRIQNGGPVGILTHLQFAADNDKALILPEWGVQFGDNTNFLSKILPIFEQYRYTGTGSPAGKILGLAWHNLQGISPDPNAGGDFFIQKGGKDYTGRPKASKMLREWHQNATWLRTV
jgi:hypothetical protein